MYGTLLVALIRIVVSLCESRRKRWQVDKWINKRKERVERHQTAPSGSARVPPYTIPVDSCGPRGMLGGTGAEEKTRRCQKRTRERRSQQLLLTWLNQAKEREREI